MKMEWNNSIINVFVFCWNALSSLDCLIWWWFFRYFWSCKFAFWFCRVVDYEYNNIHFLATYSFKFNCSGNSSYFCGWSFILKYFLSLVIAEFWFNSIEFRSLVVVCILKTLGLRLIFVGTVCIASSAVS